MLTVTDVADYGDWFDVYDFGVLVGTTSEVPATQGTPGGGCG